MAEYGSMFLVSGLATILFFGGWHGPIPIFSGAGLTHTVGETNFGWSMATVGNLFGLLNFLIKSVLFVTLMMWIRWTLPRLRVDQVLTMCWKYCVPIACFCFIGALAWRLGELPTAKLIAPSKPLGAVREHWTSNAPTEPVPKVTIQSVSEGSAIAALPQTIQGEK